MGGRTPGYRLSSEHFQTVKRMLAREWPQKMLCIIVPNRRTASPEFLFSTPRSNHPWIFMLPGSDHPDIRDPWIRSSRYSLTPDQIIPRYSCPPGSDHPQKFASPGSDHPDIRYPEIKSSPDIRAPRSDHPDIPGPRSNHPQIFVLPGAGHPDIYNP